MGLAPDTRLGSYQITGKLGEGGMGEVYRAHDTRLGRDVAIKALPDGFGSDRERVARFEHEARMLASLNHPHIAAIYGVEEMPSSSADQAPMQALVLELVEGLTLADRLLSGPPPVTDDPNQASLMVFLVEPRSGRRELWKEIVPRDPAGIMNMNFPSVTPDGQAYGYTWHRAISDLYLVEGLR